MHIDYIIFDHRNYFYEALIHYSVVYFWVICVHIYVSTCYAVAVEHMGGLLGVTW